METSFKQLVKDTLREMLQNGEMTISFRRDGYEPSRCYLEVKIDNERVAEDYFYIN